VAVVTCLWQQPCACYDCPDWLFETARLSCRWEHGYV